MGLTHTREKLFPQSEQMNGRSLVWERLCRVRCSARLKTAPQSLHCTELTARGVDPDTRTLIDCPVSTSSVIMASYRES